MCIQNKGENSKESFYWRRFIRKVERHLLVHHVLNSLLDLAISSRLMAVVQHGHHRIHAPEHFSQHLVLVRQGEAGWDLPGKGVVPLVCWQLSAEERKRRTDCCFRFQLWALMKFTCSLTHLSWTSVSLFVLSSASFSSILLWALAASSLARTRVALRVLGSQTGALAGFGAWDPVSLVVEPAEEAGEHSLGLVMEAPLVSSPHFLILWRRDLRAAMSSLERV